jgi:hypothetical protein
LLRVLPIAKIDADFTDTISICPQMLKESFLGVLRQAWERLESALNCPLATC